MVIISAKTIISCILVVAIRVGGTSDRTCTSQQSCSDKGDEEDATFLQLNRGTAEVQTAIATEKNNGLEDLFRTIQDSFTWMYSYATPFGSQTRCRFDGESECPITSDVFEQGKTVNVYPGGKTICLDESEYFFQVTKRNMKKLHIHFQGGGACWNYLSYALKGVSCLKNSTEEPETGIFNMDQDSNPLKDFTYIVIQYCSGDMHGGDTHKPWGPYFKMLPQKGYVNAQTVLQYALKNFEQVDRLVVSGSSAGALALQLWAGSVLRSFKGRAKDIAVIHDSFLGIVYPPSAVSKSEAWLFNGWNMCNTGVLTYDQKCKCNRDKLLLADVWVKAIQDNPGVRFSSIQSKTDKVQIAFEKAFELTAEFNIWGALMTNGQFYKASVLQLHDWMKFANFKSFLVQASQHTYLPMKEFWTATSEGANADSGPSLTRWIKKFVKPRQSATRTVCAGETKIVTQLTFVGANETHYCTPVLAGN